jgi:hypothetical protein
MPTTPETTKKAQLDNKTDKEKVWQVLLFNCECHSYDDVVEAHLEAIGCTVDQAIQYALVAEEFGYVSIFQGTYAECKKVVRPLLRIGLRGEVEPMS